MKFIPVIAMVTLLIHGAQAVGIDGISRNSAASDDVKVERGLAKTSAAIALAEIKKLDRDLSKVTLKHGPLPHLGMPAMTMMFKVSDPAQLSQLSVGNMVEFVVERSDGTLLITSIQLAQ